MGGVYVLHETWGKGDMQGVVNMYFVCSLIVCQNQRLIRSLFFLSSGLTVFWHRLFLKLSSQKISKENIVKHCISKTTPHHHTVLMSGCLLLHYQMTECHMMACYQTRHEALMERWMTINKKKTNSFKIESITIH